MVAYPWMLEGVIAQPTAARAVSPTSAALVNAEQKLVEAIAALQTLAAQTERSAVAGGVDGRLYGLRLRATATKAQGYAGSALDTVVELHALFEELRLALNLPIIRPRDGGGGK